MTKIFTAEHRGHLKCHGYVRMPGVLPREMAEATVRALSQSTSIDADNPETWYRTAPGFPNIIAVHHLQELWDNRQHPRVFKMFSELWGTERLWVSMDRVAYVPPGTGENAPPELHWDIDPRLDSGIYQALVYLTDTPHERAPFCCLPSVFTRLASWLAEAPNGFDFASPRFSEAPVRVPGSAGDFVIWDPRLPHGPGDNHAARPRYAQALSMFPPSADGVMDIAGTRWTHVEQAEWWRAKRVPPWWRSVPGLRDPEPGEAAQLTTIGRKLVGLSDQ